MHLCLLSLEYRFKILKCSSDTFKTKQNDDTLVYIVEYFVSRLLNPVTSLCPAEGDGPFDIDVYLVGSRCKEMGWLRGNGCPCWGLGGVGIALSNSTEPPPTCACPCGTLQTQHTWCVIPFEVLPWGGSHKKKNQRNDKTKTPPVYLTVGNVRLVFSSPVIISASVWVRVYVWDGFLKKTNKCFKEKLMLDKTCLSL